MTTERSRKAQSQEKRFARRVGGRVQPGSGSGWRHANDVRNDTFLFEMKRTDNPKQITIKAADLEKLRSNAIVQGRIPALHIEIGTRRGRHPSGR